MTSAASNNTDMVRVLLDAGAITEAVDKATN